MCVFSGAGCRGGSEGPPVTAAGSEEQPPSRAGSRRGRVSAGGRGKPDRPPGLPDEAGFTQYSGILHTEAVPTGLRGNSGPK